MSLQVFNINIQELVKSCNTQEVTKGRRRKTADEINLLERCFAKDQDWNRDTVEFLKTNTQLSYTQIYKWGWDQKKKVEKNPNAKKIPTIDEFGGYCKFDQASNVPLDKVLDIDWNEQIRLLDLDCEREEQLKQRNTEPKEKVYKRVKTEDSHEPIKIKNEDVYPEPLVLSDDDSFCTPPKKVKRQRYCSDATNATRAASKKFENLDSVINPFLQDDAKSDYDFEDFQLGSLIHFNQEPYKVDALKVSFLLSTSI